MREIKAPHTGLLRLGLALEQSVVFWQKAGEDKPVADLQDQAWDEGWFSEVSRTRARYLVTQLEKRFPFEVRNLLHFKAKPGEQQNRLVCHWSLQLTDPVYRDYTCHYLLNRWASPETIATLDGSQEWVRSLPLAAEWSTNTVRRMASGLLSAATEAGLCSPSGKSERTLRLPPVTEEDRDYLGKLLKLAGAEEHLSTYLTAVGYSEE